MSLSQACFAAAILTKNNINICLKNPIIRNKVTRQFADFAQVNWQAAQVHLLSNNIHPSIHPSTFHTCLLSRQPPGFWTTHLSYTYWGGGSQIYSNKRWAFRHCSVSPKIIFIFLESVCLAAVMLLNDYRNIAGIIQATLQHAAVVILIMKVCLSRNKLHFMC